MDITGKTHHPNPSLPIFLHQENGMVFQSPVKTKIFEFIPIKPADTIVGSDPDVSLAILKDIVAFGTG